MEPLVGHPRPVLEGPREAGRRVAPARFTAQRHGVVFANRALRLDADPRRQRRHYDGDGDKYVERKWREKKGDIFSKLFEQNIAFCWSCGLSFLISEYLSLIYNFFNIPCLILVNMIYIIFHNIGILSCFRPSFYRNIRFSQKSFKIGSNNQSIIQCK